MMFRRPEIDVQIHVNKPVFHAGGELDAHVRLAPKGDYRVRHGRVELVCTETWVQRVDSQYGPSYHRKTEVLSSEGETFMDDQTVRNGVPYSADLRVSVPRDALPTLSGALVQKIEPGIAWAVKVDMDVARARDIHESHEVTVAATPAPRDDRPVPAATESRRGTVRPYAGVVPGSEARSGDRVDGSLASRTPAGLHRVRGQGRARQGGEVRQHGKEPGRGRGGARTGPVAPVRQQRGNGASAWTSARLPCRA